MNTADHLVKILNEARTAAGLSSLDMHISHKHDMQVKTARETLNSRLNKASLGGDLKLWYYVAVIASLPNNTFWKALTDSSEVMSSKHWASSILMQQKCEKEEVEHNLNRFSKRKLA